MQRLRMSSGEENMRWPVGLPLNLPLPIASLNHESQTSFASFVDNENELFLAPSFIVNHVSLSIPSWQPRD